MSDDYEIGIDDSGADPYETGVEDPYSAAEVPSMSMDMDGDGFADTTFADQDGDGMVDTIVQTDVYTGASAVGVDTDGDGQIDTFATDYDGDGLIDEAIVDGQHQTSDGSGYDDGPFPNDDPGADPSLDPTVDPTSTDFDGDGFHGEPTDDIEYHQVQPGPVDCLPTSVSMVISEITGAEVPAGDLVQLANDNGFMTDSGMSADNTAALLEHYGIESTTSSGTIDDLREALDNGDPIIVGVDSADVYNGGGGPFDPGMEAGHAVVITGIDDGPPGVVYINDPGFPDGAGVQIEMDMFIDAWEDSDNTMVIAEAGGAADDTVGGVAADAGPAAEAAEGTDDGLLEEARRIILLPLTFVLKG